MRALHTTALLTAGLLMFACQGGDNDHTNDTNQNNGNTVHTGDTVAVSGTVLERSGDSLLPADGVRVTARMDIDGDGQISPSEQVQTETDGDGLYSLTAPVAVGGRLVVIFEKQGLAPALKPVVIQSLEDVVVGASLVETRQLTCSAGGCTDDGGAIQIQSPSIAGGYVRAFNPMVDADKFPGPFGDDQGNLLISAVFASFELEDENGDRITQMPEGEPALVRMQVPVDTWSVVVDLAPGNGQIDIPMYSFNETSGQWVAEDDGWLEDASGNVLSEADEAALRDGTFPGTVFAVFEASHFSYWNVDWPIESHACVQGRLVDESGAPVAGAEVSVFGLTYNGRSSTQTTAADGTFCVDVMRSELPGENVDNDSELGETQQIMAHVAHAGKFYRFGPFDVTTEAGSCPSGCQDLSDLPLTAENEVALELCTITGVVTRDGSPVAGVMVNGTNEYVDQDLVDGLCTYPDCTPFAFTDENGQFTITPLMASFLRVTASHFETDGTVQVLFEGAQSFLQCPTDPINIRLDVGYCWGDVMQVSLAGDVISWTAGVAANLVMVSDSMGSPKWQLFHDEGLDSPLTYGSVPTDAMQVFPQSGPPAPLASGDTIYVYPMGGLVPYEDLMCTGIGMYFVP